MFRRLKNFADDQPVLFGIILIVLIVVLIIYIRIQVKEPPMTHAEEKEARGKLNVQKQILQEEINAFRKQLNDFKEELYMTRARQYVIMETLMQYVKNNESFTKRQVDEYINDAIKNRQLVFNAEELERQEKEAAYKKKTSTKARTKSD